MTRYSNLNIFLHWLLALMIIAAFTMGTYMVDLKISPAKLQYFAWHKWLGISILAFVALRLITRLVNGAPSYPESMKQWEKQAANVMHISLYILMFAVPLSGYLYTCAAGYPVVYFQLFEIPSLIQANPTLKPILKETHEILNNIMCILVLFHIAAALKHHFIEKDGILFRMLPSRFNP